MPDLYIVNATPQTQRIPLRLNSGRKTRFEVPMGGQDVMGDEFGQEDKMLMIQHLERFGGIDISETNKTPPGFCGIAYRWDRPARESEIERAHEVDLTRREKVSAGEMVKGAKAFDGRVRGARGVTRPQSMVTETTIEETVPLGETPPSGGLRSTIIGDVQGGQLEIV
jgi:hypothetical protein